MLRSLVLILLLVNAGFYAWSQGWLNSVVGTQPDAQHEPHRLQRQIHADQIVVLAPQAPAAPSSAPAAPASESASGAANAAASAAASAAPGAAGNTASAAAPAASTNLKANIPGASTAAASSPNAASTLCIEAGPFTAAEFANARVLVGKTVPTGAWTTEAQVQEGQWLVYMGPYADADQLERKEAELRRIKGLLFEEIGAPANLARGLSLGRFKQEAKAEAALNALKARGVRTARVVMLRAPGDVHMIRVPAANERTQVQLAGLKLPPGKGFVACR